MNFNFRFGISSEVVKSFIRDLGILLHTPAVLAVPSIIVLIVFEEYYALPSFLGMAALSLLLGQGMYQTFKRSSKSSPRNTIIMVALAWLLIPIIGSIPFYFIGHLEEAIVGQAINYGGAASAFFESMSGFTSTGLSMVTRPDTIPQTLQFWRSISEWTGGMGLILLAVSFFSFSSKMNMLYQAEAMSWMPKENDLKKIIYSIWYIYLSFTVLTILIFYFLGMSFWEALNHGLTGVSTGGFSITSDSFMSYSVAIKWVTIVVMALGAISFQIHYLFFFKGAIKKIIKISELRLFVFILIFLIPFVAILNPYTDFVDNVFQTVSALGTCGFNSVPTSEMPVSVLFLFIIAMSLGGNASSTAGGIKTRRAVWTLKGIMESVRNSAKEDEDKMHPIIVNNEEIKDSEAKEQVRNARNLLVIWLISLALGSFLIFLSEEKKFTLYQIVFDVSSALNSVGLSAGMVSNDITPFSKIILSGLMWIGRLEIFACIILIYSMVTTFVLHPIKSAKSYIKK